MEQSIIVQIALCRRLTLLLNNSSKACKITRASNVLLALVHEKQGQSLSEGYAGLQRTLITPTMDIWRK
jgi:hypothetical protein